VGGEGGGGWKDLKIVWESSCKTVGGVGGYELVLESSHDITQRKKENLTISTRHPCIAETPKIRSFSSPPSVSFTVMGLSSKVPILIISFFGF